MRRIKTSNQNFDAGTFSKVCRLFSFKGDNSMTKLERLQRDSDQLMDFVEKLAEEGRQDLVKKLQVKKAFLDQRLDELSQELVA